MGKPLVNLYSIASALLIISLTGFLLWRGVIRLIALKQKATIFIAVIVLIGAVALGIWVGTSVEIQINSRIKIQGVPIPLVVFVLENQGWTDFPKPLPLGYLYMLANTLTPVAIVALAWMAISRG